MFTLQKKRKKVLANQAPYQGVFHVGVVFVHLLVLYQDPYVTGTPTQIIARLGGIQGHPTQTNPKQKHV